MSNTPRTRKASTARKATKRAPKLESVPSTPDELAAAMAADPEGVAAASEQFAQQQQQPTMDIRQAWDHLAQCIANTPGLCGPDGRPLTPMQANQTLQIAQYVAQFIVVNSPAPAG